MRCGKRSGQLVWQRLRTWAAESSRELFGLRRIRQEPARRPEKEKYGRAFCSALPGDARGSPSLRCAWSWRSRRNFLQLFRGHSVERRHGDAEDPEVCVKLASVVDLMLRHRAQKFPDGHGRPIGGGALAQQVLVAKPREDAHGFGVHPIHELDHLIVTVGQFAAASCVAIASAGYGLCEHISLHGRDVARQIAECKFAFLATPFQLCGRNTGDQSHGARAYFLKVVEEGSDCWDLHGSPISRMKKLGHTAELCSAGQPRACPER